MKTPELEFPESEFETYIRNELAEMKKLLTDIKKELCAESEAENKKQKCSELLNKTLGSNGWAKYTEFVGMCGVIKIDRGVVDSVIAEAVEKKEVRLQTTGMGDKKTKWICKER